MRIKGTIFFGIVILLSFNRISFSQTVYYVSSSEGDDNNDGLSPENPLKSLIKVSKIASTGTFINGDSIKFKRDDMWIGEFLDLSVGMPMSSGDPIVLTDYNIGNIPVFCGGVDSLPSDTLLSKGIVITSPNFIIENLEIKYYLKDGIHANVGRHNDLNMTLNNIYVHDNGSDLFHYHYGIYLEGKNTKILNSEISYNENDGVYIVGANLEIAYCNFTNNGTGYWGDEIQISWCDDFWVHDNYIIAEDGGDHGTFITKHSFTGGVFERNYCYGDYWGCGIGGYGSEVRYNYFVNNTGYGIRAKGNNVKVYDNIIINTRSGIIVSGPREYFDGGITEIYNNTIINASEIALNFDNQESDSIRIKYENNIIASYQNTVISISGNARIIVDSADYNLFYPDSLPEMFKFFDINSVYKSLTQWQEMTGYDLHSVSGDPLLDEFYNPSDGSPAINAGINLSELGEGRYNIDITGYYRPVNSLWDIGAVENMYSTPVELSLFSSVVEKNKVILNWQTATETNNSGFDVESNQAENQKWKSIGFVVGYGTTTEPTSYSFIDENRPAGIYQYRLKQIDYDGSFEYSNIVEVEITAPLEFSLVQNYPNPFNPNTTIEFTIPQTSNVSLKVYNLLGQEVRTLVNGFKDTGMYKVNFDAKELNSGMYIYKIEAGSFTQVRKMTLLK